MAKSIREVLDDPTTWEKWSEVHHSVGLALEIFHFHGALGAAAEVFLIVNPVFQFVNLWMTMGAPYAEAWEIVSERGFKGGYSVGVSAAIWEFDGYWLANHFLRRGLSDVNRSMSYAENHTWNAALSGGYIGASDLTREQKQQIILDLGRSMSRNEVGRLLGRASDVDRVLGYASAFQKAFMH